MSISAISTTEWALIIAFLVVLVAGIAAFLISPKAPD